MIQKQISINDFHYDLPTERIAKYPLSKRDSSKLLVYKQGNIQQSNYSNISEYLTDGGSLFFNNTKVIPARMFFETSKKKQIEIFCLEPVSDNENIYIAMLTHTSVCWKCLVGNASSWKETYVNLILNNVCIKAEIKKRLQGTFIIEFSWQPSKKTFAEVLQLVGAVPIPPYLKRSAEAIDTVRYQTIYAEKEGSVAAPTAGLHFTDDVFEKLKEKNIVPSYITLHVGAGTFKPVKCETMADHEMHIEYIDVSLTIIEYLLLNLNKDITAVGTTSLRTLESLYWIGEKIYLNPLINPSELNVDQWQPYQKKISEISLKHALQSIVNYLNKNKLQTLYAKTSLLIVPGYAFKVVNALITNFHQPESTLILLIASFVGEDWRKIYDYALNNNFRFLSYGDGSLLFRKD